jgi:hypothetical protein
MGRLLYVLAQFLEVQHKGLPVTPESSDPADEREPLTDAREGADSDAWHGGESVTLLIETGDDNDEQDHRLAEV